MPYIRGENTYSEMQKWIASPEIASPEIVKRVLSILSDVILCC
jgi:hypothetical protein